MSALAAAGLAVLSLAATPSEPVRHVTGGAVRGRLLPQGSGAVFRGIPFAAPPVGPLRWREPQPVVPWSGVREADRSGPPPVQENYGWNAQLAQAASEDCLYLDVWTPVVGEKQRCPVMVWIHGGANTALAGGQEPVYEGQHLIAEGVVLVVIEYRLGIFGFFAHPELSRESPRHVSGNYALLDQLAALRWVRDNIAQFGGDPGNVTVFGQSAGAWNIVTLMSSPLSAGLFHRAIAQSGVPPAGLCVPLATAEAEGRDVAAKLHAPDKDTLAFLRQCTSAQLLQAGPGLNHFSIDGVVLPEAPLVAWRGGRQQAVPLIIGGNAIEFPATGSLDEVRANIRATFGDLAPRALTLYGLDAAEPNDRDPIYGSVRDRWGSDLYFRLPARVHGEWHQAAGHRVWQYEFDRPFAPQTRAQHSTELAYVFGNFREKSGMVTGHATDVDRALSAQMRRYWTNFAKHGDPNGPGVPEWPAYDAQGARYQVFTMAGEIATAHHQRGAIGDLFRELLSRP